MSRALEEGQPGGIPLRDLRATFATRLDAAGVGAFTIKNLLGHSTLDVTKRYVSVDESSRLAVAALASGQKSRQNSGLGIDKPLPVM